MGTVVTVHAGGCRWHGGSAGTAEMAALAVNPGRPLGGGDLHPLTVRCWGTDTGTCLVQPRLPASRQRACREGGLQAGLHL